MSTEIITRAALAGRLGLGAAAAPSYTGVATMLREATARWGSETRRLVQSHVRRQCDAAGFERSATSAVLKETLDHLLFVGEISEAYSMGQPLLACVEPFWVDVGGGCALALGTLTALPAGLRPWSAAVDERSLAATLRRFELDDQARAILLAAGIVERRIDHVTDLPGQIAALRLDLGSEGEASLKAIWLDMERKVSTDGLQLGEGTSLHLLSGAPGGFFGRHDSPGGRWSRAAPDGVWLGAIDKAKRGLTPCLVLVRDGAALRTLSLRSWDVWRWLLLARAEHTRSYEVIKQSGALLEPTFALPGALRRRLTLLNLAGTAARYRFEVRFDDPVPSGFGVTITRA